MLTVKALRKILADLDDDAQVNICLAGRQDAIKLLQCIEGNSDDDKVEINATCKPGVYAIPGNDGSCLIIAYHEDFQ